MKSIFQILFVTLLLSACSSASASSTISPTITSTATFQNTETPQPTGTPTLSATETPLSEKAIAKTATHKAAMSVEATVAAIGTICQPPARDYYAKISPDGKWIAMECRGEDGGVDSHLHVIDIQKEKEWIIHYADYANGTEYGRRNMIRVAYWTADGKYLYANSTDIGSGCCWIGGDVLLVQLNLENGQQTVIANYIGAGPGLDFNFSISPSERYILYIPQDRENNLFIWDTQNSKQRNIKLEDTTAGAGHTLMSSDEEKVILVLRDYPKEPQGDLTFGSLVLIDLKSGSLKKLLSSMDYHETPIPVSWQDNEHVLLQRNDEFLLLDINTGELSGAEQP